MATSKDALKKDETEEAPPPPKKSKKLLFIILGAVVVSIVIGLLVGKLVFGGKHAAAADDQATADDVQAEDTEKAEPKLDPRKPPVFVNLEPFTVNLQPENNTEQFLQVVATLRVSDDKTGETLKQYMPQIRDGILTLMSSKHASEIISPDGREELADEIRTSANEVLGFSPPPPSKKKKKTKDDVDPDSAGPVISVFFTQFIVQ